MSRKAVIDLLSKGGDDRAFRVKYDNILDKEKFVVAAAEDGFEFTVAELDAVIRENGDSFDSNGNPPKKRIWM